VAVDINKIKSIMECDTPKDVVDIIYSMGLAGYYRRFIKGFSEIGHSITSLQRKGVKCFWTTGCEESFHQLKHLLTSASVLPCVHGCLQGMTMRIPHAGRTCNML